MAQIRLVAQPRSEFGKGAARRLRREGLIPAVVYGEGTAVQHIAVNAHDLTLALAKPRVVLEIEIGGKVTETKPRDVQRDPVKRTIEHVDLIVLVAGEAKARGKEAAAAEAASEAAAEAAAQVRS